MRHFSWRLTKLDLRTLPAIKRSISSWQYKASGLRFGVYRKVLVLSKDRNLRVPINILLDSAERMM